MGLKRRTFTLTPDELLHYAAQKIAEDHVLPPSTWNGSLIIEEVDGTPQVTGAQLIAEERPPQDVVRAPKTPKKKLFRP